MAVDNPIEYKDFVKKDSSIDDLIAKLEELQNKNADALKSILDNAIKAEKKLNDLNSATAAGRSETKKTVKEVDKLEKAQKNLTESQSKAGKELAALKLQQQKQNQLNKLQAKLNGALEGSYDQLSAQYSLNKIKLNAMSKAERDGTKAGRELEESTKDLYEEMKRLQEATGNHTLSVGDYANKLGELPGLSGQAVGGLQKMNATLKVLAANPVLLTLTILGTLLSAMFALFTKTKAGTDLLAKGSAALSGGLSFLVGVVDSLYKGLISVFEDPVGSLKAFGKAVVDNVINRFKAVILMVEAAGKAVGALVDGDMDGLEQAAKDAGSALVQLNTGLDAEQQKEFAQSVKETTSAIYDQLDAFVQLEQAKKQAKITNRELEKSIEDLTTQEELNQAIADDATKSFAVREAAAQKAASLTAQRAKAQLKIGSRNLSLINKEIDLRKANGESVTELLDQQLDAYKTLSQSQREYLLAIKDNQKRENELKQDRLEKDLDILIDGFDNQKTINERLIADDSKTMEARFAILNDTKDLFEKTFNKQIETIQRFTGVRINMNDLINESDAVVLNQKIRSLGLSEIIEGRLLEVIRERRTAVQDLAETEKDLNAQRKALAQKAFDIEVRFEKERYENSAAAIDAEYDLRRSQIDILKITEAEKTELMLNAEKDRLKKLLALNESGQSQLSEVQLQILRNTIEKIDQELKQAKDNQQYDIYSIIGLTLKDDQKQAISESVGFTVDNIRSIFAMKEQMADNAIGKAREEITSAEEKVRVEEELQKQGLANDLAGAKKELKIAQDREKKALKLKQDAQKAQNAIDTAAQVSSLITASANIWKSLSPLGPAGPGLAIAAIATMFGSYTAAKITASNLAKEEYGDGGYEFLKGGSHASGNDIPIGRTRSGKQRTAEGGETLAIIKKSSTARYRKLIPKVIDSLNNGSFEKTFMDNYLEKNGLSMGVLNANFDSPELKEMNGNLEAIRRQGEGREQVKRYTDSLGRQVEIYKNVKTTYNV